MDDTEMVLYTPEQVAEMLNVKPYWIKRQARDGALSCVRLGKQIRFRQDHITDYLQKMEDGQ